MSMVPRTFDQGRPALANATLWQASVTILVLATLALIGARTVADPDLWGHLRFGLDNLHARAIIAEDPYSYVTAGQQWVNHEWLAEVAFALAWTVGGESGLVLLKMGTVLLTMGILYWRLRRDQVTHIPALILLLLAGALPLIVFVNRLRPGIFTYLLFALLVVIISLAEEGCSSWLWTLPPLFVLWANLHGGFLAGLGALGIWAAMHIILDRHTWTRVLPPTIAAFVATLANPYGLALLVFLLRTATGQRPEIQDWQPIKLLSMDGLMYVLVLTLACAGLTRSTLRREAAPLVLLAVLAVLPWIAMRHLPLFCIGALVLTGKHVVSAWTSLQPEKQPAASLSRPAALLPLVAAVVLMIVGFTLKVHRIQVIPNDYPITAVALLKHSGMAGNLVVDFGWGEYAIWHLGPQIKVGMDGRRETVYPDDVYRQYLKFAFGIHDWDTYLTEHPADAALVKRNAADYNLLKLKPGWMLLYEDGPGALFVKEQSSQAEVLQRAAQGFKPPQPKGHFP